MDGPGGGPTPSPNSLVFSEPILRVFQAQRMFDLTGKTAVVIGGTSGIGFALAQGLARAGANVVPTGRRNNLVEEASRQIRSLGRRSLAVTSDVTQTDSLRALLDAAVAEFSGVDIL